MIRNSLPAVASLLSLIMELNISLSFATEAEIVSSEFILKPGVLMDTHAITAIPLNESEVLASFYAKAPSQEGDKEENNSLYCIRGLKDASSDGYIWQEPVLIVKPTIFKEKYGFKEDRAPFSCYNPVLMKTELEILLFTLVGSSPRTWTNVLLKSFDQGYTWNEPEILRGALGPTKHPPIYRQGKYLCPSSRQTCGDDYICIDSTQDFKNWQSQIIPAENLAVYEQGYRGFIHPVFIESKKDPNSLLIFCRPRRSLIDQIFPIHYASSQDGGKTWSQLKPISLENPDAGIDALRLNNDHILMVYNKVNQANNSSKVDKLEGRRWSGRSCLALALSKDEGQTWQDLFLHGVTDEGTLEGTVSEDTGKEFSYPEIFQDSEGYIHVFYTVERNNFKHVRINLKKSI